MKKRRNERKSLDMKYCGLVQQEDGGILSVFKDAVSDGAPLTKTAAELEAVLGDYDSNLTPGERLAFRQGAIDATLAERGDPGVQIKDAGEFGLEM